MDVNCAIYFLQKSSFAWQKNKFVAGKKDFICWLTTTITHNIRMPA